MYSKKNNVRMYALNKGDCVWLDRYRYTGHSAAATAAGSWFTARRGLAQRAQTTRIQEALKKIIKIG